MSNVNRLRKEGYGLKRGTVQRRRTEHKASGGHGGCDWPETQDGVLLGFLQLAVVGRWSSALLSDLRFYKNGVREYERGGNKWTLIIRGKVGVLLDKK